MGRAYEVRKASMAKTQAAKSKVYAKYGKEIYMAAKSGTPDIDLNVNLKRLVEKAKSNQVPADVINRAIEKAKGSSKDNYDSVLYEAFSVGGAQVMVECLTDNVNRTISEVRNCFTKTDGKIGATGSLQHLFKHIALFAFTGETDEETILEALIMNEVEYLELEISDDIVEIQCDIQDYNKMRDLIENLNENIEFKVSEIMWIPGSYISLDEENLKKFEKLMAMLEECEDVQDIYHNVEV